ncbi:MAG: zinc ribbon domain-containing protein [Clostridium sp.]|jgi:uncharacterized protein (DUF2164 family)|nr:zinc ribbon domain-containing protein [Clostridium sp.]
MDFINKVGETLTSKGKDVAKKAKEIAEITGLHTQISIQEAGVNRIFQELGKMYYEQQKSSGNAGVAEKCGEIDAALAEVERLKKTLMLLKGVKKCPGCNAEVTAEAAFCSSCGAPIPQEEAAREPEAQPQETAQAQQVAQEDPAAPEQEP